MLRGILVAIVLIAAATLLTTCGGSHRVAPPDQVYPSIQTADGESLDDALAELDELECPDGVDEELWAELKDALEEALNYRAATIIGGTGVPPVIQVVRRRDACATKLISTPPTGDENRVTDLAITDNGDTTYTLSWHYRNLGDYDQNGTVGISDITPIAMHYGETYDIEDVNCLLAVIDGSGNGEIDIADITPIAMNYGVECVGYDVEQADSSEGPFTNMDSVSLSSATGDGRKEFSVSRALAPGRWIRVVPVDGDAEKGIAGSPVLVVCLGIEWLHTWGGSDQDIGYAIEVDSNGNQYVAGRTQSFGGTSAVLLKYDSTGSLMWQKTWGVEDSNDQAFDLCVNETGDVYVTGVTGASETDGDDVLLQKYRPDGSLVWQKAWDSPGEENYERANALTVDNAGNIYATGISFALGVAKLVLLKFSPDGELQWDRTWEGGEGIAVIVDDESSVYVAGTAWSIGMVESDVLLLKTDAAGNLMWGITWYTERSDYVRAMIKDSHGELHVATVTSNTPEPLDYTFSLLRYSPDGELISEKGFAGEHGLSINGLALDTSGFIYAVGNYGGEDFADVSLLKLTPTGELVWSRAWGPQEAWNALFGIAVSADGKLYATGEAKNVYGGRKEIAIASVAISGSVSTPQDTLAQANGTVYELDIPTLNVEGLQDEGAGSDEVLVIKYDLSLL
ncbi:hypothetical protein J7J84_01040 [bacterium]|nr:hypothetical protein [bacterium]